VDLVNDEYGKQIGKALEAIALLQSDVSRLFKEMHNDEFRGYDSVFGSFCTKDVSKDYKRSRWMPKAVYRYYRKSDSPLIDGVTAVFLAGNSKSVEPVLIVSQVMYRILPSGKPRKCKEWDVYNLYVGCDELLPNGEIIFRDYRTDDSEDQRFDWAKLVAVPVYSIADRDRVKALVNDVRNAKLNQGNNDSGG